MENNNEQVRDILEDIRPLLNKVKVKSYKIRKMLNGDYKIRFRIPGDKLKDIYADLFVISKEGVQIHMNFEHSIVTITKKHTLINVQNSDTIQPN